MAKSTTALVLVSSASNTAGSTTRGRADVSTKDGGEIRWKITNGATGPTVQCTVNVLVAQSQGSMPAAAAEGTGDTAWKQVFSQGGGTSNNGVIRGKYRFGPEVQYIEIEFTGNTAQTVTVECTGDAYSY